MNTYHITQSMLNNIARTNAIIAMNNSSSSITCPAWFVWFAVALVVAFAAFGAWVIWDTWYR
jgi:hypothetical protein